MHFLKQSTAATIKMGPFVDSTDGVTAETGLTISQADVRLSKEGGDMAQKNDATSATHDELGYYDVPLNTTDTNTLGRLRVMVSESGALPVWQDFMVLSAAAYLQQVEANLYPTVWYLSASGNDSNDGRSRSTAKLTRSAVETAASNGDKIIVLPGTYTGAYTFTKDGLTWEGVDAASCIFSDSVGTSPAFVTGDHITLRRLTCTSTEPTVGRGVACSGKFCTFEEIIGNGTFDGGNFDSATEIFINRCRFTGTYDAANMSNTSGRCLNTYFTSDGSWGDTDVRAVVASGTAAEAGATGVMRYEDCSFVVTRSTTSTLSCDVAAFMGGSATSIFENCRFDARATNAGFTGDVYAIRPDAPTSAGGTYNLHGKCLVRGGRMYVSNAGSGVARYFGGTLSGTSLVVEGVSYDSTTHLSGTQVTDATLRPTTAGTTLDVSSTGEAGVDWANVGSPTTTVTLSGTTVKTATDVETDTQNIQSRIPASLVSGRIDASVGAMASAVITAAATHADYVTEVESAVATSLATYGALKPTVAGRTLDVTINGNAGLDWGNVENTSSTVSLTATSIKTASDVETDTQDIQSRLPAALTAGGHIKADAIAISGDTAAADTLEAWIDAAVVPANVTQYGGVAGTFASGRPQVNTTLIEGTDATDAIDARLTAYGALKPTIAGRTLDVTTTGEAGIDLANIGSPTTSVTLSGLTIKSATDVETDTQDIQSRLPAALAGGLMQSDVVAISGQASAADVLEDIVFGNSILSVSADTIQGSSAIERIQEYTGLALQDIGLDHLMSAAVTNGDVTNNSVIAKLASKSATAAWSSYDNTSDSMEAHRDLADSIYAAADHQRLVSTVIATLASQTSFTLSVGSADDDAYNGQAIVFIDQSNTNQRSVSIVTDYTGSTKTVTLTDPPKFTVATGDTVVLLPIAPGTTAPTAAQIADAVWDETATDHVIDGSTGDKLLEAAAGGGGGGSGGPVEQTPVPDEFTWVVPTRGSTNLAGTKTVYIQPSEKILVAMDFTNVLHAGDALSEIVAVTEHTSQPITLTAAGVCGNLAKFWIEDADASGSYRIECRVSTRFGLTLEGDGLAATGD